MPNPNDRVRRKAGPPRDETEEWVRLGIISTEQRDAIFALYPPPEGARRDRAVLIFSILGSILVAAGVILYFAANWPLLPAWVKVGAIYAAIALTYWGGYRLAYAPGNYPIIGKSLIFLAALFYGAGIWLAAQIFHLGDGFPAGYLLWGLGVLPMAWVTSSAPILYASAAFLTIWMIQLMDLVKEVNYLYPILLLGAVLPLARRLQTWLAEAMVIGGVFFWFAGSAAKMINITGAYGAATRGVLVIAPLAMLYGALLWSVGTAVLGHDRLYLGFGGLFVLGGAFTLTFRPHTPLDPQFLAGSLVPPLLNGPALLTSGVVLILAGTFAAGRMAWKRGRLGAPSVGGRTAWFALGPAVAVAIAVLAALTAHLWAPVPRAVVFNLFLFAGTVGLITIGVQRRSELLVNLGLVAFTVHAVTRYTDLFFRAIDRALFFIVGGLLLLGGGWLVERSRRRLTQEWGTDGTEGGDGNRA